jgi:uncharacterized coiled-coil DUF342 family protein
MITDKDINKLKKVFATKSELKTLSDSVDKRFIRVLDVIDDLREELRDFKKEMREFRDQTNKTLDWLVGAFKKFDEEHSILTARYSTISKTVDKHELRITNLEKTPS